MKVEAAVRREIQRMNEIVARLDTAVAARAERKAKAARPLVPARRRLPPYGREWLVRRNAPGCRNQYARVAIGLRAWEKAREAVATPIMVLPMDDNPAAYHWPVRGEAVLIFETLLPDDDALERLVHVLLVDGATLVTAIRWAYLPGGLPSKVSMSCLTWVRS